MYKFKKTLLASTLMVAMSSALAASARNEATVERS
jgi:nucleoside-specific outer membrane channel protein Tsx